MKIIKEVLIHDKRWKLEFKSFGDCLPMKRFELNMTCLEDTKKSVQFFNVGSYYHVIFNFSDIDYKSSSKSLKDTKLKILKYLLYENF